MGLCFFVYPWLCSLALHWYSSCLLRHLFLFFFVETCVRLDWDRPLLISLPLSPLQHVDIAPSASWPYPVATSRTSPCMTVQYVIRRLSFFVDHHYTGPYTSPYLLCAVIISAPAFPSFLMFPFACPVWRIAALSDFCGLVPGVLQKSGGSIYSVELSWSALAGFALDWELMMVTCIALWTESYPIWSARIDRPFRYSLYSNM